MLTERIHETNDGFWVTAESNEKREIWYGFYSIATPQDEIRADRRTEYWKPGNLNEKKLPENIRE